MNNKFGKVMSKKRMDKLEKAVVNTIATSLNKSDGNFTVNEIGSVLNKLAYQYTQRGLDNQYLEADGPPEGNDNVQRIEPKGKA